MSLTSMLADPFLNTFFEEDPLSLVSNVPLTSRRFNVRSRLPVHSHVDVLEDDKTYSVFFELAGVSKDQIDIQLDGDNLIMTANKADNCSHKGEEEKWEWAYRQRERSFGKIRRSIVLPTYVNKDNVKTVFNDGVLRVDFDKPTTKKLIIA